MRPEGMAIGQRWRATCGESTLVGEVKEVVEGVAAAVLTIGNNSQRWYVKFAGWSWERLPDPEVREIVIRWTEEVTYEQAFIANVADLTDETRLLELICCEGDRDTSFVAVNERTIESAEVTEWTPLT